METFIEIALFALSIIAGWAGWKLSDYFQKSAVDDYIMSDWQLLKRKLSFAFGAFLLTLLGLFILKSTYSQGKVDDEIEKYAQEINEPVCGESGLVKIKTGAPLEDFICRYTEASSGSRVLVQAYINKLATLNDKEKSLLKQSQIDWAPTKESCISDNESMSARCLNDLYLKRAEELSKVVLQNSSASDKTQSQNASNNPDVTPTTQPSADVTPTTPASADVTPAPDSAPNAQTKPTSSTPSFDCTKAVRKSEQLICGNPELASLDSKLDQTYKLKLNATSNEASFALKTSQRVWVRSQRDACNDVPCLVTAYKQRIEDLSK